MSGEAVLNIKVTNDDDFFDENDDCDNHNCLR